MTLSMATKQSVITISEFTAAKQSRLFGLLKQSQFNGQLQLAAHSTEWTFEFYMGRLLYVMGGKQPMRRWYRYVKYFCPDLYVELSTLKTLTADTPNRVSFDCRLIWIACLIRF
ncbi:MAG: hypothetical protein AAF151_19345 [Cyanobacteria bacterium J06656_5]